MVDEIATKYKETFAVERFKSAVGIPAAVDA